ncbi:hypothetical protein BJ508DRAFT_414094 [Ascobolus immersus RN42]|uniref:Rhodopsin domain-containing protein n=1 Tax=Ascobolus immersus RN42 TaxID=1160509 RepID=A0A3N4I8N2_ASCIM|nr:hypothetical protein BJ508DRAFT_414094 [Ascobolus immersus RN42]
MIMWSIKAGFITYYYDLRRHFSKRLKLFLLLVAIYTAMTFLAIIVSTFTWCRPLSRNWNPDNFCTGQNDFVFTTFTTVCHITSDILLLTLSFSIIRSLQLGKAERYALSFILLLGATTLVAASLQYAVTTQIIVKIKDETMAVSETVADAIEKQYLSGVVESVIAIITVSLPSLRALLRRLVFGRGGSRRTSARTGGFVSGNRYGSDGTDGDRSVGTIKERVMTIGGSGVKSPSRHHYVRSTSQVEELGKKDLPFGSGLLLPGDLTPSPVSFDSRVPPRPTRKDDRDSLGFGRVGSLGSDTMELRSMGEVPKYWPEPDEMPGRIASPASSIGRMSGRGFSRPGTAGSATTRLGSGHVGSPQSYVFPMGVSDERSEFGYAYEVTGGLNSPTRSRR